MRREPATLHRPNRAIGPRRRIYPTKKPLWGKKEKFLFPDRRADPGAAALPGSVLVQVPRPERFAIHKLIVADRRRDGPDELKARGDRAQAAFLIDVLSEERPEDLADAYGTALESGPAWRSRIERTLARMRPTAKRLARLG